LFGKSFEFQDLIKKEEEEEREREIRKRMSAATEKHKRII